MGREKKQEYALFTAWGASFIATLGSLYFSEIMKFEPCVLCWYQRIFMYPFVLWLGIAVVKKRLSHRKLFFTDRKYWCLYFFISLCNSKKSQRFSAEGALCGRVPCTGEYINWFGFVTIPFLALIGFITIAVCSFIVIKNK
ncbi:disulfide oxidoreductase [Bacillus paranthracis]